MHHCVYVESKDDFQDLALSLLRTEVRVSGLVANALTAEPLFRPSILILNT